MNIPKLIELKLLIGGARSKFFHLKEFGDALAEFGVEYKLVPDIDIFSAFPNKKILYLIPSQTKFNRFVEEFKPDAVFTDVFHFFGLLALKARKPLFVQMRGDYWSEVQWSKQTLAKAPQKRLVLWWGQRIAEKCVKGATSILPICKYLETVVRSRYPNKSTDVLYQGIRPSLWYDVPPMNLKHPCVGLLQDANIWGKTVEMFTLTKVLEAMPEVTFYWVGDGPYRDHVLPTLSKFDNFKWLGKVDYPDGIREYLAGIDVYALVSGIDMSPLTMQEASLMQRPIVATNTGGIPELMDNGKTGFLVEKGDSNGWIEKISILVNDGKKARQMGVAGSSFIQENFNWNIVAKRFTTILNSYLS